MPEASQVANLHKAQINEPCKEPSTAKRKNAASSALLKPPIQISPGAPSVYGTELTDPSWADLGLWPRRSHPRVHTAPVSSLYYHKADVTSQTFALCSQYDVLHDAYQFNGRIGPRPNMPHPPGDRLWF